MFTGSIQCAFRWPQAARRYVSSLIINTTTFFSCSCPFSSSMDNFVDVDFHPSPFIFAKWHFMETGQFEIRIKHTVKTHTLIAIFIFVMWPSLLPLIATTALSIYGFYGNNKKIFSDMFICSAAQMATMNKAITCHTCVSNTEMKA